ncbi:MAG: hypothetical protein ACPKOP_03485 [Sphaerochaetaceae bacterium]
MRNMLITIGMKTGILLLCILLPGCYSDYLSKSRFYYNRQLIVQEADSFSYFNRIETREENFLSLRFTNFYGKDTLLRFDGADNVNFGIDVSFHHLHGRFVLYLVDPDDNIITLIEEDGERTYTFRMRSGPYRLVSAGIEASGTISIITERQEESAWE